MPQSLHPDFETTLPNTGYFFLGSGALQATIQVSRHPMATPLGLLISRPEHFARKWSTHLFHPEYGLERTMVTVIIDGVRYLPDARVKTVWYPRELPGVAALWNAGAATVLESFCTSIGEPVLIREFTVSSELKFESVEMEVSLYGNPALFSEFGGHPWGLGARGYDSLLITSPTPGFFHERTLRVPMEFNEGMYQGTLLYSLGAEPVSAEIPELLSREAFYWMGTCARWTALNPNPLVHDLERLFSASAQGLRAVIGSNGRFDASIWQYGFEWTGDASNVVEALVYSGQFEVARDVLTNILTRMTTEDGMAMEASRFRGGKDAELNNNGEILRACSIYHEWTGDLEFIAEHYPRIAAIANYLLLPEYLNAETGMLMASRDIWERSEAVGMKPGYDVAHQTFGILGLRDASRIAKAMGHEADRSRWSEAAKRMRESFLNHPTHSMIQNGRIIKRRLLDGSIQTELTLPKDNPEFQKNFVPDNMPLRGKGPRLWEPDISECLAIVYGVIDPRSDVAKKTVGELELLWSQSWEGGGYGRYNVLSEPDSPGPWPFATIFMAAACLEVGEIPKAQRAIEWLIDKAGEGCSWLEFYGERPTPPLPPTGIIVWAWAQWIILMTRQMLGARVKEGELLIEPRMPGFSGALRFKDKNVAIPIID